VGKAPKEMWCPAASNATMPKSNCCPWNGSNTSNVTVQGFKVQRFRVDNQSEPLLAGAQTDLLFTVGSGVHETAKWRNPQIFA
jgi:hypothetical protein